MKRLIHQHVRERPKLCWQLLDYGVCQKIRSWEEYNYCNKSSTFKCRIEDAIGLTDLVTRHYSNNVSLNRYFRSVNQIFIQLLLKVIVQNRESQKAFSMSRHLDFCTNVMYISDQNIHVFITKHCALMYDLYTLYYEILFSVLSQSPFVSNCNDSFSHDMNHGLDRRWRL